MATILVTVGLPDAGFEEARVAGHTILMPAESARHYSKEELDELLPLADAVIACKAFTKDMIDQAVKLQHIANYGAGYDSVDIRYAAEKGIPVTNIPETVTDSTAELAVGLMLSVCRRIGELDVRMRREQPESLFGLGHLMGRSLRGMTLGIIGAGRIGGRTAQVASAFGMRVMGYSRRGADPNVMQPASFDEVIAQADVLSLHCPMTSETAGLISRDVMARMKPGAVLINTARGGVVDTEALCDMLESGHLAGAGLDVYPDEPHVPQRLLSIDTAVLTPHVGSNTLQTRAIMAQACCRQIMDVLAGKRPDHIVNGL